MNIVIILFMLVCYFQLNLTCFPLPPTTTTTTTTTECSALGGPCGECCDGLTCAPLLNICIPSIPTVTGRKRRSAGCGELTFIERKAFVFCEVDGEDGLAWEEVATCEAR